MARLFGLREMKILFLTALVLFVCGASAALVMAQESETKSQILIAYEARSVFTGTILAVGPKIESLGIEPVAQTIVLKQTGILKGEPLGHYVSISISTFRDLNETFTTGEELLVLLDDSNSDGSSKDCGGIERYATSGSADKFSEPISNTPCFIIDGLKRVLNSNSKELVALKNLLKSRTHKSSLRADRVRKARRRG